MGWIVWLITLVVLGLGLAWWARRERAASATREGLLKAQLGKLEGELEAAHQEHSAQLARLERERARLSEQAHLPLAQALLPALDALWQAEQVARRGDVASPPELTRGLGLVVREVEQALARHDITRVAPSPAQPFDPAEHEAVAMAPATDEVPSGAVHETLRAGWRHTTRTLRPAMVQVASSAAPASAIAPNPEPEITFGFEEAEAEGQVEADAAEEADALTARQPRA